MAQGNELTYEQPKETIRGLSVGEETAFPLKKINSVRQMCSNLKVLGIAVYRTHIDHENQAIRVKRIR